MKKIILFLISVVFTVSAYSQIPKVSLEFIHKYYPSHTIKAHHKIDRMYFVILNDDTRLWFKSSGALIEMEGYVPSLAIPYQINNHLLWHYPNKPIHKYTKHRRGHSLHFKNGKRMEYTRKYKERK